MATLPVEHIFASLGQIEQAAENPTVSTAVTLFHFVRSLDYLSDGGRDPIAVYKNRAGSCSGKHILLRDLLRAAGFQADVETIEGDFTAGVPVDPSHPDDLKVLLREGDIRDFHQYVHLHLGERSLRLDATWPNKVSPFGIAVNDDWAGDTDTVLAVQPMNALGPAEDIPAFKEQLLQRLSPQQTERRLHFLKLLSDWVQSIDDGKQAAGARSIRSNSGRPN